MTNNMLLMGLAVVTVGTHALPSQFTVEKDLKPRVTAPHPWTEYTYYFENGNLVDSLRGMNTRLGCTIELTSNRETLSRGDNLRVTNVSRTDAIQEECAEWGTTRGGDEICIRLSGHYFPVNSWEILVDSAKVRKFYCTKRSDQPRSIREPMTDEDRLSTDDLQDIFGKLIQVEQADSRCDESVGHDMGECAECESFGRSWITECIGNGNFGMRHFGCSVDANKRCPDGWTLIESVCSKTGNTYSRPESSGC